MFRYKSGEPVEVGDVVITGNGKPGIVRRVLFPGTEAAKAFACPDGGVLIEEDWDGHKGYLAVPMSAWWEWEDVRFLRRGGA